MRVTLCDNCSKNVRPNADPNRFGHSYSVEIPKDFERYVEGERVYDFCSPYCRAKWFADNGRVDLTALSTEQLVGELAKREGVLHRKRTDGIMSVPVGMTLLVTD